MDARPFLQNLALVLSVAGLTSFLFHRLRLPVVLGYLVAGMIVSPHNALPLYADEKIVHTLSELGVILLMFSLGLEFSLAKLRRVGPMAALIAVIETSFMMWLGYTVAGAFGWSPLERVFTAGVVAISSTTIVLKAFAERGVDPRLAEVVFGVLIVEDLIAIVLITVCTALASGSGLTGTGLAMTLGSLAVFLVGMMVVGLPVVPRFVRRVAGSMRDESLMIVSVALCFICAQLADRCGFSVALGAFLAGTLIAESGEHERVAHLVAPMRDLFAAVFFVSVGMLVDPAQVPPLAVPIVVFTMLVVIGKTLGVSIGAFFAGQSVRTSVRAGMSLAQIGEFSFILAGIGIAGGVTGSFLSALAVSVSVLTTLLTPAWMGISDAAARTIDRRLPRPVQTFVALYATWIERLRQEPTIGKDWLRVRRLGQYLLIDSLLLAAVLIATALGADHATQVLLTMISVPQLAARLLVVGIAAMVAGPLVVGIVRCTQSLGALLARLALPVPDRTRTDLADAPRRALMVAFQMAILLFVGTPFVLVTEPFLPQIPIFAALVLSFLVLGVAFWRSANNLQEHARAGAQMIIQALGTFDRPAVPEAAPAAVDQVRSLLPGLGAPAPVTLSRESPVVGRTLSQINLRGRTGATVLAVVRDGSGAVLPSGHEMMCAGDVLFIAGTPDSVAAARSLLETGVARTTRPSA